MSVQKEKWKIEKCFVYYHESIAAFLWHHFVKSDNWDKIYLIDISFYWYPGHLKCTWKTALVCKKKDFFGMSMHIVRKDMLSACHLEMKLRKSYFLWFCFVACQSSWYIFCYWTPHANIWTPPFKETYQNMQSISNLSNDFYKSWWCVWDS